MAKRQIKISESKLHDFVSYSVARLLKEAIGRELTYNGDFDGYDEGKYGSGTLKLNFDPYEDDNMKWAVESVIDEGNYPDLSLDMFLEGGQYEGIWPIPLQIRYNVSQGLKGDGYLQPDDPDEIEVTRWDVLNPRALNVPDGLKRFVSDVLNRFIEEEDIIKEYIDDNEMRLNEENRGITTHFGSDTKPYKAENPYEDMTWDEYKEKKSKEREDDKRKRDELDARKEANKGNRATTVHFTSKDIEEMVRKAVKNIMESI